MSVSFQAQAVIGCLVSADSLDRIHKAMLKGLYVVSDTDKQHFIIGPLVAQAWADEIPGYEPLEGRMGKLEQQTRDILEPLGLWDANTFGLYAVPYVSY